MNLDIIKKTIQDFFQEGTLTIVGSGLSMAEGISGMSGLTDELKKKMPCKLNENELDNWNKVTHFLNTNNNLESALHEIKIIDSVEKNIRKVTSEYIRKQESNVLNKLIKGEKRLRFSSYINKFTLRNQGITVITTNYDRLIEFACEQNNVRIDTLFVGRYFAKFDPDESKYSFCRNIIGRNTNKRIEYAPKVTILKPHGCLSWFLIDGTPYSLPLEVSNDCLIIPPGANKYFEGYNIPFDTHREKANYAIDHASKFIIIGYGFSDDHLQTHLIRQIKNGKPTIIFTYSLSSKSEEIVRENSNVTAIIFSQSNSKSGSSIITQSEELFLPDSNLWDIGEMLKEVF